MVKIRNKQTGEIREVSKSSLPKYGIVAPVTKSVSDQQISTQEQPQRGLGERIASFLAPRAAQFGRTVGTGLGLQATMPQVQQSQEAAYQSAKELQRRALQEGGEGRAKALKVARSSMGESGRALERYIKPAEQQISDTGESTLRQYGRQGLGVGGEVGTWLMPTLGPAGQGIGKAGLRGALTGTAAGTLYGATSPEQLSLGERAGKTATGAVGGAAIGGAAGMAQGIISAGWRKLTDSLPETLRRWNLKLDEEMAKWSLDEDAPGTYKKMVKWAKKINNVAGNKLDDLTKNENYQLRELVGDDPRAQEHAIRTIEDLSESFKKKGMFEETVLEHGGELGSYDKVQKILGKLKKGKPVSFSEANYIKSRLDRSASRIVSGGATTEQAANTAGARANVANTFRNTLRNTSDDVAKLLDTQSNAYRMEDAANKAVDNLRGDKPFRAWEIMSLLGGASSALAFGRPELAAVPLTGIFARKMSQIPVTSKALYGLGQAAAPQATGQAAKALTNWLTKRGAMEAAK